MSSAAAGPRRITFVTSPERCNLRCRMCREHSPLAPSRRDRPEEILDLALVEAVLEERRGSALAEVIPSTHGEPLLWPGMEKLLARCASQGLRVNLTTNGTWPRLGARGWAERLVPVSSDVKVSWNGAAAATAEAVMEGLSFDDAVEGVRELVAVRDAARARGAPACAVSFQVTAQEANVGELAAIVRLAGRLGVDRVKLNQLQVHFAPLADGDLRRSPAARARWNGAVLAARAAASETGVRLQNGLEMTDGEAPRGPCPFLGREAWVLADGSFAPCPSPTARALAELGSLHERSLGAIWEGDAYRELAASYERRPACAACPFRRPGGL